MAGKRILVVDDHPDSADLLATLIRAARPAVQTQTAFDGSEGLRKALGWRPHVVITDIDMPVLSGIEAALEMRSRMSDSPLTIVAVTGDSRWRNDAMALAVFDQVMLKPVDLDALLQIIT